jgi:hypothetical protein
MHLGKQISGVYGSVYTMNKCDQVDELVRLGLTHEEALLYLFLLDVKSSTIGDIHRSPEYREKLRPNLYKIINSLERKGFVREEVKDGMKKFFPEPPKEVLDKLVVEEGRRLEELRGVAPRLSRHLEDTFLKPSRRFPQLPDQLRDFVDTVNKRWFLNETPEVRRIPMLGVMYSAEFHTHRRSGANTAGLVVNEFRYSEHRDGAIDRMRQFQKEEMGRALEHVKNHGVFRMKKYWFEDKFMKIRSILFLIPYSELHLKLSIPGEFKGGMTTLRLEEYPTELISIWGANHLDFRDLVTRIAQRFRILPERSPRSDEGS